jgi:hypothetical protein
MNRASIGKLDASPESFMGNAKLFLKEHSDEQE